jgi:class 3 adenylate cyclase
MRDDLLKSTEKRLWTLIAERAASVAAGDTEGAAQIERRIWDLFGETWAVMFTDLSGFSRQVEAFGILHFLQIIWEHKTVLDPVIAAHDGILVKTEADSLLLIFRKVDAAVRCAVRMQQVCEELNATRSDETKLLLCVGIGYGPLLRIGDHDVFGQEVNAASKLGEDTARAREILITDAAKRALVDTSSWPTEPIDSIAAGSAMNWRLRYGDAVPRHAPA